MSGTLEERSREMGECRIGKWGDEVEILSLNSKTVEGNFWILAPKNWENGIQIYKVASERALFCIFIIPFYISTQPAAVV